MSTFWIELNETLNVGDVGFLVGRTDVMRGVRHCDLRDAPALTNMSGEARLVGWCGCWNDVSIDAYGMARVIRVARSGRILVCTLSGEDLVGVLVERGYPELAPPAPEKRRQAQPSRPAAG